jgi:hypothetical protein
VYIFACRRTLREELTETFSDQANEFDDFEFDGVRLSLASEREAHEFIKSRVIELRGEDAFISREEMNALIRITGRYPSFLQAAGAELGDLLYPDETEGKHAYQFDHDALQARLLAKEKALKEIWNLLKESERETLYALSVTPDITINDQAVLDSLRTKGLIVDKKPRVCSQVFAIYARKGGPPQPPSSWRSILRGQNTILVVMLLLVIVYAMLMPFLLNLANDQELLILQIVSGMFFVFFCFLMLLYIFWERLFARGRSL